jgi:ribosome maturation factor RimP
MAGSLKTEIESLVTAAGIYLIDLDIRTQGRTQNLDVFVDTEAGITAGELSALSRTLGTEIENRDLIKEAYTLNVSSPGLERPLRFPWQYRRHKGRSVLVTYRKAGEAITCEGTITDVSDEQIVVHQGDEMIAVQFLDIDHAVIQAKL